MKFLRLLGVTIGIVTSALTLPLAGEAHAASPSHEAGFLALVNAERAAAGLGGLTVHPQLATVARAWTDEMVGDGTISHNPNLAAQAPAGWQRLGENVGMGGTVDTLHKAFMSSPGHRANVLGDYNQVGIGVSFGANGTLFVTLDFRKAPVSAPAPAPSPVVAAAAGCGPNVNPPATPSPGAARGYYVLGHDGGIFAYGSAPFRGSVPGLGVAAQAVLMAVTPSQGGYWVLGHDGGIFSFGNAGFFGSVPGLGLAGVQAIDLKPTPSGRGYWILGADGGIFSFGDAAFFGSVPGLGLHSQSVSMAATPSGRGYWLLGADGGIFAFGDARYAGSVPGLGDCATVRGTQIVASRTGGGYYVLSDRGGVYAFGDAPHYGAPAGIATRDMAIYG